jgi:hypothetical protein
MSNVPGPSRRSDRRASSALAAGMPRGRSLYGAIPEQLVDETSFLRQLQAILRVRSYYGIATRGQVDFPQVSTAACSYSSTNWGPRRHQLTVVNFANEDIVDTLRSEHLPPGRWSDVGHVYRQGFCLGRRSGQLRGGDAAPPRHVAPRRKLRLRGLLGIDVVTSHGRSWQEAHRPDQGPKQRHVRHKMVERTGPISALGERWPARSE